APRETGGSLHDRLARLGAEVLADGLRRVRRGEALAATAQRDTGVTYAHKIDKAEARIDWTASAQAIERKVRAFDPWPVAEADVEGERLRIWSAEALAQATAAMPGTIVAAARDALDVATGDGILRIRELQREGGRRMPVRDWLNARREPAR